MPFPARCCSIFLIFCASAYAGVAINLIPYPPAPLGGYEPGQTITVDVMAQLTAGTPSVPGPGGTTNSIRVRNFQLDLSDTFPELQVSVIHHHPSSKPYGGPIPFWDFSGSTACTNDEIQCGTNYFIDGSIVSDDYLVLVYTGLTSSGSFMITLNQSAPKRVGELQVTLPTEPGTYVLDVLNADETDQSQGAEVRWGFGTTADPTDATSPLRANTGGISGGQLRFSCPFPPGPDCNNNFYPDYYEDCNANNIPDSCDTTCHGDACGCQGPFAGEFDGPSVGSIASSLDCEGEMDFKFVTGYGPILFQTTAQMSDSGVITGNGQKIKLNGQFNFSNCTATGTWNLFGGQPGTWSTKLTRECLPDCNQNRIPDSCDLRDANSTDCNQNEVPDECDISTGASFDCNHNNIPDECEDPPVFGLTMTDPPDGLVDVRQDRSITGQTAQGFDRVRMSFTCQPYDADTGEPFNAQSFRVASTSGAAPLVFAILEAPPQANTFDIILSDPIPPGAWTTITANVQSPDGVPINPQAGSVTLGFLPADVNGNGRSTPADILALVDHLNGIRVPPLPSRQCDIDRSGQCFPSDIVRLIDLLNGTNSSRPWLNIALPPQP